MKPENHFSTFAILSIVLIVALSASVWIEKVWTAHNAERVKQEAVE